MSTNLLTDEGYRVLHNTAGQWSLFTELTRGFIAGSRKVVQKSSVANTTETVS